MVGSECVERESRVESYALTPGRRMIIIGDIDVDSHMWSAKGKVISVRCQVGRSDRRLRGKGFQTLVPRRRAAAFL